MKPIYDKNGVQLYCGDALDIVPTLPEVDLVVADPPFNLGKEFDKDITDLEYYDWCKEWIRWSAECLSDQGSIFLMTVQQHVGRMMKSLEDNELVFRNMIIWHNSSMPTKKRFCIAYQPILYYVQGAKSIFNYGSDRRVSNAVLPWGRENKSHSIRDIWDDIPFISGGCMASREAVLEPDSKRKAHPCQMPLALAERMIKYTTDKDDLVLDPFAGSGTTLVKARDLNCRAIGIEKNQKYCDLIISRLEGKHDFQDTKTVKRQIRDIFDE